MVLSYNTLAGMQWQPARSAGNSSVNAVSGLSIRGPSQLPGELPAESADGGVSIGSRD